MRGRIEKHWPGEEEMNGKDEEGGVKGLRKDCSACLIIETIICNHLPPKTRAALYRRTNKSLFLIILEENLRRQEEKKGKDKKSTQSV